MIIKEIKKDAQILYDKRDVVSIAEKIRVKAIEESCKAYCIASDCIFLNNQEDCKGNCIHVQLLRRELEEKI